MYFTILCVPINGHISLFCLEVLITLDIVVVVDDFKHIPQTATNFAPMTPMNMGLRKRYMRDINLFISRRYASYEAVSP